ncbi:MAG: hypothetical protein ACTTJV_06750 [Ottowia sp.]
MHDWPGRARQADFLGNAPHALMPESFPGGFVQKPLSHFSPRACGVFVFQPSFTSHET